MSIARVYHCYPLFAMVEFCPAEVLYLDKTTEKKAPCYCSWRLLPIVGGREVSPQLLIQDISIC